MPPDSPRSSRLRRSYLITPLNKYCCQYERPSKNLSYGPVRVVMKFLVLWPGLCWCTEGWGGKCWEILATVKLLYNPRVNIVFTSLASQTTGQVSEVFTRWQSSLGTEWFYNCGCGVRYPRTIISHLKYFQGAKFNNMSRYNWKPLIFVFSKISSNWN